MSLGPSCGIGGHVFFNGGHVFRIFLTRLLEVRRDPPLIFGGEVAGGAVFESRHLTGEEPIDRQPVSGNYGERNALAQTLDAEHHADEQPHPGRILDAQAEAQ